MTSAVLGVFGRLSRTERVIAACNPTVLRAVIKHYSYDKGLDDFIKNVIDITPNGEIPGILWVAGNKYREYIYEQRIGKMDDFVRNVPLGEFIFIFNGMKRKFYKSPAMESIDEFLGELPGNTCVIPKIITTDEHDSLFLYKPNGDFYVGFDFPYGTMAKFVAEFDHAVVFHLTDDCGEIVKIKKRDDGVTKISYAASYEYYAFCGDFMDTEVLKTMMGRWLTTQQ